MSGRTVEGRVAVGDHEDLRPSRRLDGSGTLAGVDDGTPGGSGRAGGGADSDVRRGAGVDRGTLYARLRGELVGLLRGRPPTDLDVAVPATPGWMVRDVLAHVVALPADLNARRFPTGDPDAWTAAQVAARRGRDLDELAAEWECEGPTFEEGLRLLGDEIGSHFAADLLVHATDVREALGVGVPDDPVAVDVALDHYLGAAHQRLEEAGVGTLVVTTDGDRWALGRGPERAWLAAPPVEVLRATSGRWDEARIRSLEWSGDVDAVLPLLSAYPLPRRTSSPSTLASPGSDPAPDTT